MAKVQLLVMEQGEDFAQTVLYENPDGSPVDNSGMTAAMWIAGRGGGPVYIELTDGSGLTLNGADGTIGIALTAAQTELLPVTGSRDSARFAYDLKLYGGGETHKVLRGEVLVHRTVTVP